MVRSFLIYLRYFWPVAPAVASWLILVWVLWGMGLWVSVVFPVVTGGLVFLFFSLIGAAAAVPRR